MKAKVWDVWLVATYLPYHGRDPDEKLGNGSVCVYGLIYIAQWTNPITGVTEQ